jgi:hypothetical protein
MVAPNTGPISGNWKRLQFYPTPQAVFTPDPSHLDSGDTLSQTYTFTQPPPDLPPTDEYFGYEDFVVDSDGTPGDQTPEDHSDGMVSTVHYTTVGDLDQPGGADADMIHQTTPQHSDDRGSVTERNKGFPGVFLNTEAYGEEVHEGYGADASFVSEEALRRGINAEPQNNPGLEMYDGEGWRRGVYRWPDGARNRKMQSRVIRTTHDMKAITPNTAYAPPNVAAVKNASPNNSPFSSLSRVIQRVQSQPMLRRTPPASTELVYDDGTSSADEESIIGGGF